MRRVALPLLLVGALAAVVLSGAPTTAAPLALCGNSAPPPTAVQHVVVLMMENLSYNQVVGSSNAPFQTSLAQQCGSPPSFFAATHSSAANYLALSDGQFPAASTRGCGSVSACRNGFDTLYNQLDRAGLTWAGYMESMPTNCSSTSSGRSANGGDLYKLGHNPIVFSTAITPASCAAHDIAVSDLTAQSGPFWSALQDQTLPAFSFVSPNGANNNAGGATRALGEKTGDTFLQKFLSTVQQSNSYQAGNTVVVVTYDEGLGGDSTQGEDCTDQSRDLPLVNNVSAHQESCHIPTFVVYPYTSAGDADPAFFDLYSITKGVEDLFSLPYLAHAGDAQTESLVGHFGIPAPGPVDVHPSVRISSPTAGSTASGTLSVTGTATSDNPVSAVQVSVDGGTPQPASGAESWSLDLDTTALSDGQHTIGVQATDTSGDTGTASVVVTVQNSAPPPPPPACQSYTGELSGNLGLETAQTGWTGVYNGNSVVTRTAPTGGSFEGSWALRVTPKATGAAGANNAKPGWVPGPPGTATTARGVYTGSAQVRASVPGQKVSLLVRETTPSGAGVGSHATTLTLADTAWHPIASSYTATATGNVIRYSLYSSNFTSTSQYLLGDCLSLHRP